MSSNKLQKWSQNHQKVCHKCDPKRALNIGPQKSQFLHPWILENSAPAWAGVIFSQLTGMPENFKNEAKNYPKIQLISSPNPSEGDSKTCWKIISKKHPKCDPQGPHKGPLFCSNPTIFPPLAPQVPTPGANQEPQMPQACQSRIQDLLLGVTLGHFMPKVASQMPVSRTPGPQVCK